MGRGGRMLFGVTEENFLDSFGGQLHYACPSGWLIYSYRGRDYHLDESIADPEIIMKASLGQGKNLLIKAFPSVDLYPDPTCDY